MSVELDSAVVRAHPRTVSLVLAAAAAYLGRLGSAAVLLVTVPMVRASIDAERFGVWMMLSGLLAFLSFADFGLGNGLLNRVTAAQAAGRRDEVARAMRAGLGWTAVAALLPPLFWAAWCLAIDDPTAAVGTVSAGVREEVRAALQVFVVLVALAVPASLLQRAQLGLQQGYWVGAVAFVQAGITLAAVPIVLHAGGGLVALLFATLGVQVATNAAASLAWLVRGRWLAAMAAVRSDRALRRGLGRDAALFFALQLTAAFAFQSDAIVVSQVLGPVAYGEFAVVQRVFALMPAILSTAMLGLWPAFGDALARGDLQWVRRALARGLASVAGVALLGATVVSLSLDTLLRLWLERPPEVSARLVASLAAWTVVEAAGGVTASLMNAAGAIREQLWVAFAMAGAAFAGKWWATDAFGASGAVLATLCAYCLISVPGQFLIIRRALALRESSA